MPCLSVCLFGPLRVTLDGEPVTGFESDKARALLAYLSVEAGVPQRRERLAGLLWPNQPEPSARTNLRRALANVRTVIADRRATPPFLHVTRQTIQFNRSSDAWVDVSVFANLLQTSQPANQQTIHRLKEAVDLVRGSFLEGFSLSGCPAFDEWMLFEGERLQRQALEALGRLSDWYERQGKVEHALEYAWRQVGLEPWREEAHRQVMRLLARGGQRGAALAQYETCRRGLVEELGVEPGAETTHLYEQIRDDELQIPAVVPASTEEAIHSDELAKVMLKQQSEKTDTFRHALAPEYNLPPQPTPFFGREEELAVLEELIGDPAVPLVTIVGPGGIGKTRLALAASAQVAEDQHAVQIRPYTIRFPHGIVFVPLAPLTSPEDIAPAIAQSLQMSPQRGHDQLLDSLRRKQLLLILDSFEHLSAGIELLIDIMRVAPGIKLLVTSREQLQLHAEHLFPIHGLTFPGHDPTPSTLVDIDVEGYAEAYPAIRLFVETVRRVQPGFALRPDDLTVVTRICRLMEGMPLALELAASWADALSLGEILGEARQSLDLLRVEWHDVPERQRSMRAVFDASWQRLNQAEQVAFCQLSVFRGGFSREPAGQVVTGAEATPHLLAMLVRKSFLQHDQDEQRYQIHELLRQYGAEKLALDPALEVTVRDQHSRHYCGLLGQQEKAIKAGTLHEAMRAIQGDIENVRAACLWAAKQGPLRRLEQAVNHLGWFYYRGYPNFRQGEITFSGLGDALAAADTWPSSATASAQRTMARILAWRAQFRTLAMDLQTSEQLLDKSRALLDGPALAGEDTRLERAHISFESGYNHLYANPAKAQQLFAKSVEIYRQINHKLGLAYALLALGRAASNLGALEEAREAIAQSVSLHRDMGNPVGQSESLLELGSRVAKRLSRFQEAEDLIRQSLSLVPESNRWSIALGLVQLSRVQFITGRFVEAETCSTECIAVFEDMGSPVWVARQSVELARARLHAGAYRAARTRAEATVSLAQEIDWVRGVSYGKAVLGEVALAKAAFALSYRTLQESLADLKQVIDHPWDVNHSAWLGLAARGLGRRPEAWQHLVSALDWASKHLRFMELMVALAGIALLLADEGKVERAVEFYALASRHPFVANSRWFEEVIGRHIAAVAGTLPLQVATAAQERGQTRDLASTVEELVLGAECIAVIS